VSFVSSVIDDDIHRSNFVIMSHKFSLSVAFDLSSVGHEAHPAYTLLPSSSYLIDVDSIIGHRLLGQNMRSDSIGIGGHWLERAKWSWMTLGTLLDDSPIFISVFFLLFLLSGLRHPHATIFSMTTKILGGDIA
jgi:hypothetical protein